MNFTSHFKHNPIFSRVGETDLIPPFNKNAQPNLSVVAIKLVGRILTNPFGCCAFEFRVATTTGSSI